MTNKGGRNPVHPSIIESIRKALKEGRTQQTIAKETGVSQATVSKVNRGKR